LQLKSAGAVDRVVLQRSRSSTHSRHPYPLAADVGARVAVDRGMSDAAISPSTVAAQLLDGSSSTRLEALRQLEDLRELDAPLALAAGPALVELMARDAAEVPYAVFQRVGFMVARLLVLVPPEELAGLYGASMGEERGAAMLSSKASVIGAAAAKAADELTRDDALSYAAAWAFNPLIYVRGWSAPWSAAESDGDPVKHAAMHGICDPFSKCVGAIWCSLLSPFYPHRASICLLPR
jgi:hypothetical protein